MTGDTIINSLVYHKIYRPFVYRDGTMRSTFEFLGYIGALRQNVLAKKVFFVPQGRSNEGLLYDFSLTIGDTMHLDSSIVCPYTQVDAVIYAVDSILVDSSYRRELWAMTGNNLSAMIEGVGSWKGLLEVGCYGLNGERWELLCFSQNGIRIYPDSGTCNIISSVNNLSAKNTSITLSPNPFHTTAALEIKNEEFKIKNLELKIYDVMGRLVQQQIITNQSTIINRVGLGDGLYFYQLRTNNYELIGSGKFVVE